MSKYDSLLKKATFFEKLAVYGNRGDFLKAVAQGTSYYGDVDDPGLQPPQKAQETIISVPARIDPNIQDMLNRVLSGKINPLLGDGQLGPQTQNAMKLFTKLYGKPATKNELALALQSQNTKSNNGTVGPMGKDLSTTVSKDTAPSSAGHESAVNGPGGPLGRI